MDRTKGLRQAQDFVEQLKRALLRQIYTLNVRNNGELQDGFNPQLIDDGWVSLKGYSWGFVAHFDEPLRIDTTCGPDWPFTGYRTTYVAKQFGNGLSFANENDAREVYYNADEFARAALRRLADKVGDGWIFDSPILESVSIEHGPFYGQNLLPGF